jgi:hypothetical protein
MLSHIYHPDQFVDSDLLQQLEKTFDLHNAIRIIEAYENGAFPYARIILAQGGELIALQSPKMALPSALVGPISESQLTPFDIIIDSQSFHVSRLNPAFALPRMLLRDRVQSNDFENEQIGVITHNILDLDTEICVLPCGHWFEQSSIQTWFSASPSPTCPLCRLTLFAKYNRLPDETL